jgi:hypothetical protein
VTDIFQEVNEEVRREQLKKLWERYGGYLIAACIMVVIGVGAWRGYEWWQAKQAAQSGAAFEQAAMLAESGKHQDAAAAFAKLSADGTGGYRVLARLREAGELATSDRKAAVAAYDAIAADSHAGQIARDLAAVAAARTRNRPRSRVPAQCPGDFGAVRMEGRGHGGDAAMDRDDHERSADASGSAQPRGNVERADRGERERLTPWRSARAAVSSGSRRCLRLRF